MTLKDLKDRATASELTLIEAVETTLRGEITQGTRTHLLEFCGANPPPDPRDPRYHRTDAEAWVARLDKHLNREAP